MRRSLVFMLVLAMAVGLAGCRSSQKAQPSSQPEQGTEAVQKAQASTQTKQPQAQDEEEILKTISWFGHADFMLKASTNGLKIYYVDPFEFNPQGKEKADIVFITHTHFDHCSVGQIQQILKADTVIVSVPGCVESLNLPAERLLLVEPNKSYELKEFKFRTVPAYNIKPERTRFHPKANNWVGYIFNINGKLIYHAGDTDFIDEMKPLVDEKLDVALLPIGGTFTMDVDEAIQAANAIKAKITIPMHYFRLLGDKAKEAEEKFKAGVTNSKVVILQPVR